MPQRPNMELPRGVGHHKGLGGSVGEAILHINLGVRGGRDQMEAPMPSLGLERDLLEVRVALGSPLEACDEHRMGCLHGFGVMQIAGENHKQICATGPS